MGEAATPRHAGFVPAGHAAGPRAGARRPGARHLRAGARGPPLAGPGPATSVGAKSTQHSCRARGRFGEVERRPRSDVLGTSARAKSPAGSTGRVPVRAPPFGRSEVAGLAPPAACPSGPRPSAGAKSPARSTGRAPVRVLISVAAKSTQHSCVARGRIGAIGRRPRSNVLETSARAKSPAWHHRPRAGACPALRPERSRRPAPRPVCRSAPSFRSRRSPRNIRAELEAGSARSAAGHARMLSELRRGRSRRARTPAGSHARRARRSPRNAPGPHARRPARRTGTPHAPRPGAVPTSRTRPRASRGSP